MGETVTVNIEFEESAYYTGPALTGEMEREAEVKLGRHLPNSYVELLRVRNGGVPVRKCVRTTFRSSWAEDHIEIGAIRGIGGEWGIEDGPLSSAALIAEWGYPDIGVVICDMPSGGHDAVMLDYSEGGDEPSVVYVDEDRKPRKIAESFAEFLNLLVRCEEILFRSGFLAQVVSPFHPGRDPARCRCLPAAFCAAGSRKPGIPGVLRTLPRNKCPAARHPRPRGAETPP